MSIENSSNIENRSRVITFPKKVVFGAAALYETLRIAQGTPSVSAQPQPSVDCVIDYTIHAVTENTKQRIPNLPIDVIPKDQTEPTRFTTNAEGVAKGILRGKSDTTIDGKPGRQFDARRLGATTSITDKISLTCNAQNIQTLEFRLSSAELTQVAAPRGLEPTATATRSPEPTRATAPAPAPDKPAPAPSQGENSSKPKEAEASKKEYISNDSCNTVKEGLWGNIQGAIGDVFCNLGQAVHNTDELLAGAGDSKFLNRFGTEGKIAAIIALFLFGKVIFKPLKILFSGLSIAYDLWKKFKGRGAAPAAPAAPAVPAAPVAPPAAAPVIVMPPPGAVPPVPGARSPRRPRRRP
jgi:hypothetical protein